MEKADLAVLVGRFSPPHLSHQALIQEAYKLANNVLILVGSANAARSIKNPFSYAERAAMLTALTREADLPSPGLGSLDDFFYSDDMWIAQVQQKVAQYESKLGLSQDAEVIMVGNYSDDSSYYLSYFPQWRKKSVRSVSDIHATDIRRMLYDETCALPEILAHVPTSLHDWLRNFKGSDLCQELSREYRYIVDYKKSWASSPFPPTFVTADNVVTCMGHVLVVERKTHPGKGLFAVPGGFIRQDELIEDAALRELKEETGIRIDKAVLRRCIVDSKVFDYPGRSSRGRTITHAFHIKIDGRELPEVRGGDDAAAAMWMPFAELFSKQDLFFEDHASIIRAFLGV